MTPAAKTAGIFIARKALDMVSFGQRFGVVEKPRFATFLLLLAASICRVLPSDEFHFGRRGTKILPVEWTLEFNPIPVCGHSK